MKTIISKDGNKQVECSFGNGKWRAYTYAFDDKSGYRIQRTTSQVSEINYDEDNDVILIRDGLKISFRSLSSSFEGYKLLEKRYYPRIDEADYLGSIFFYMDMSGNIISPVYSDVTDSFYEIDEDVLYDDDAYSNWKETLIIQIIDTLKIRSIKRQKQLLVQTKI